MHRQYTITQLSRAAAVPTTTLRFYEREGLVMPERRSPGNYRLYTDESLRRLKFIRAAQAIGFTLADARTLLGYQCARAPSCHDVQALIQERLVEIDKRLTALQEVKRVLSSSLKKCRRARRPKCCHVIEELHGSARGG
jgi:MerR family mercuric resistance operon transcriptional regulator